MDRILTWYVNSVLVPFYQIMLISVVITMNKITAYIVWLDIFVWIISSWYHKQIVITVFKISSKLRIVNIMMQVIIVFNVCKTINAKIKIFKHQVTFALIASYKILYLIVKLLTLITFALNAILVFFVSMKINLHQQQLAQNV